jgi:hypothetical protein
MKAVVIAAAASLAAGYKSELVLQDPAVIGEHVVSKRPHEYLKASDLPEAYDLRTEGLLTADLNQHIPVYCK